SLNIPTLTIINLNTLNLDYFYTKYANSYKIAFDEKNLSNTQPISANIRPIDCITKALHRNSKTTYFIKASSTSIISFCLCDKYHTNFITISKTVLNLMPTNFITFAA
ncbi:6056_t:CDS:1, partial [Scutellospora calospora]